MGHAALDQELRRALQHYQGGRPDQADAACAEVLAIDPDHVTALHLSAAIAFANNRITEGEKRLSRVLALAPNHAPALATLGDVLAAKGEQAGAADAFRRAAAAKPKDAKLHAKLGAALCALARFQDAEASLRQALAIDTGLVQAQFNLGIALIALNRLPEAEQVYRALAAGDATRRGAWLNLGHVLVKQDRGDEAVAVYRQALVANPDDPGLLRSLGALLQQQRKFEEAIACYRRVLVRTPDDPSMLRLLGGALHESGLLEQALKVYRQITPEAVDHLVLSNIAVCLCDLGRYDEAMAATEATLAIKSDHAPTLANLGIILEAQGKAEAAVASLRQAIAIDPLYAKGHANLSVALRRAGRLDEALAVSHHAVALAPDHPLTRYNHAHELLLNGDYEHGFVEFRWGRLCKAWSHHYPDFSQAEWDGEPFAGRTLLVFSDYGIGDALHLLRYLPMVTARGGKVVLQVQPPLVPLLRELPGITVTARGQLLPPFDLQVPMMELPRIFGTTVGTIPADVPYLHAEPERLERWQRALRPATGLKVGVVWAGSHLHKGDKHRSLAADALLPRLITPGVQLYSLQKEARDADVATLASLGHDITDLAPVLGDFADTAAAVSALDLIISVDTSVAHLAGSLGRPVWVLLPYALDWRWMRDRADSPWYPTMRLFRQDMPGQWEGVIARVTTELARVAAGETALPSSAEPEIVQKSDER